jgi:hypothetical protein
MAVTPLAVIPPATVASPGSVSQGETCAQLNPIEGKVGREIGDFQQVFSSVT